MTTAEAVVADLRAAGHDSELIGPSGGGATGLTCDVKTRDGVRILKWQRPGEGTPLSEVVMALTALRSAGCPVPTYEVVRADDTLEVSLQEVLPGRWSDQLASSLVSEIERVISRQAGLGCLVSADRPWGARLQHVTLHGAESWSRHDSLERHSPQTRALWLRVRSIAETVDVTRVPDGDLVHMDLHHRNVLQEQGRVRGVIDWEGVERGDRAFDRFTLAFYSGVAGWTNAERAGWIKELVAASPSDASALYVAHLSVRSVDWAIRHETEKDVQAWLSWSAAALATVDT
jgi:aminoglycoside phosphotransferase (APT) family kinase protein